MASLDSISFLLFSLHDEFMAFDVKAVIEVITYKELMRIPGKTSLIKGVINYRGTYISVIDTREKFNLPSYQELKKDVIVIIELSSLENKKIGILADKVLGIHTTQERNIKELSGISTGQNSFLKGIIDSSRGPCYLIDPQELFSSEEIILLNEITINKEGV